VFDFVALRALETWRRALAAAGFTVLHDPWPAADSETARLAPGGAP